MPEAETTRICIMLIAVHLLGLALMPLVLHVGAADGEIEYYASAGVTQLVYAEPDRKCIAQLKKNIYNYLSNNPHMQITVVPKACSERSGELINFYSNGQGQSSIEKPENYTLEIAGNQFTQYLVETISLQDLKHGSFGSNMIDYLCIDTQGHEKSIICGVPIDFLSNNFAIIDIELMTDPSQYHVAPSNWKEIVFHLLKAGFEPVIHPHGLTESYLFMNTRIGIQKFAPLINQIRNQLMARFFDAIGFNVPTDQANVYASLGDHLFLPFSHVGGAIHASLLQPFRESFVIEYLKSLR